MPSRRQFLRSIGIAGSVGLFGAGAASGADDPLPTRVRGTRVYKLIPDGDQYRRTERFVSDEMAAEYGVRELELETVTLSAAAVPKRYRDRGTVTESFADTTVIGTFTEQLNREQRLRSQVLPDDITDNYAGPLYHYNSDADDPDPGDLSEPKAPINLAWNDDLGLDVGGVEDYMETTLDWQPWEDPTGTYPIETARYITYYWNGAQIVNATDAHVMDEIYLSRQWHIRLYSGNVATDDYAVIGQAHRDPLNHNKIITVDDWHFDDARGQALGDWTDNSSYVSVTQDINNGDQFDTADGSVGRLHLFDGLDG